MKESERMEFIKASPSSVALAPLDMAAGYIRANWTAVLPSYIVAMVPITIVSYFLIDALTVGYRSFLYAAAFYLSAAMLWRWGALAYMQKKIVEDLGGRKTPFRSIVFHSILIRLICAIAMTWGAVFFVPPFYGFFASSIAAALLAGEEGSVTERMALALKWIHGSWRRLVRILFALFTLFSIILIAVFVLQAVMKGSILGGILDINLTQASMTMESSAWILSVMYMIYLCLDFYWSVAAVFVYNDFRRRRLGVDLSVRIASLSEDAE